MKQLEKENDALRRALKAEERVNKELQKRAETAEALVRSTKKQVDHLERKLGDAAIAARDLKGTLEAERAQRERGMTRNL